MTPDPAYRSTKFRSFASFLEEWLIEQDLHTLDRVFWPQSDFLSLENGRDGEANAGAAAVAQGEQRMWCRFHRQGGGHVQDPALDQRSLWLADRHSASQPVPEQFQWSLVH